MTVVRLASGRWHTVTPVTPVPADLIQRCESAAQLERKLWAGVSGKYPGQPGHDPASWEDWKRAEAELQRLAKEIRSHDRMP